MTFLPFTYTIYTLITHKCKRGHLERKTLDRFFTTHTPIFQRESYSSLVRNHCNLFSIPLPLSYIERRFVSKYNPHLFRVQRVFWSLGSFGELPKEAGEAWWMKSGILRDSVSQRRQRFGVTLSKQEAWRAQVYWVDQAWRVFCYSCIPTSFFSGLLTAWRVAERFHAEDFGFLFDNTSLCCLCICISLPLIFAI